MSPPIESAIEEAAQAGFDLNLMENNLSMTPEERWKQHDMALAVILELEEARMKRDARLQSTTTPSR